MTGRIVLPSAPAGGATVTADFRMPSLGADMDFGRVVEWRVRPGDRIARGEIIVEVETDKGTFDIESPHSGLVTTLAVNAGAKVAVGTMLATIASDETTPAAAISAPVAPPSPAARPTGRAPAEPRTPEATAPVMAPPAAPAPGRTIEGGPRAFALRASPAARKLAAEHGVDLTAVTGTGPDQAITRADVERAVSALEREPGSTVAARVSPVARRMAEALGVDLAAIAGSGAGGTITKADVERAASARAAPRGAAPTAEPVTPSPAHPEGEGATGGAYAAMRRAIAAAVSRSKREIPHYYLGTEIDLSPALTWLESANLRRPVTERLLPPALLIKAVGAALRRFPDLNGFWVDGGFLPREAINVGVAISLRGGGLIVPAIHDIDRKSVHELMAALRDLVRRARSGGLRGSEMTDATVTFTSLGDEGASTVFGVIYPPQVAVVGFGRIGERPWAENGMLTVRRVVTATLAADHRATDGHYGGLFLAEVQRLLQAPDTL